jgi:hypothetical protein
MILLLLILLVTPALGADRTVAKVTVPGKTPVEVWLTRADAEDGGLVVKVIAKGVGPRPQALTIYTGGGDDDGPGTAEVKVLTAKVMDVPAAGKIVRVDFGYLIPGTTEEETQTTLVGFGPKTHKLLELMTKRTHQRNKNCKEIWETALTGEGDDLDGEVVAQKKLKVIPVRGDDDEPLDSGCVPQKNERLIYRWNGEHFAETKSAQPSPSPSPDPKVTKQNQED